MCEDASVCAAPKHVCEDTSVCAAPKHMCEDASVCADPKHVCEDTIVSAATKHVCEDTSVSAGAREHKWDSIYNSYIHYAVTISIRCRSRIKCQYKNVELVDYAKCGSGTPAC